MLVFRQKEIRVDYNHDTAVINIYVKIDRSDVNLFNWSLAHGIVPSSMKAAYITPTLKKADMDLADVKSYRPISCLLYTSPSPRD